MPRSLQEMKIKVMNKVDGTFVYSDCRESSFLRDHGQITRVLFNTKLRNMSVCLFKN
jgi:hypothetical protein